MAPLLHLFFALVLSTSVFASPHVPRNVYNHAHRAVANPLDARVVVDSHPLPLPKRRRSLNKRCVPRQSNATTPAPPSSPTVPINVAPSPSVPSTSSSSTYSPPPQSTPPIESSPPLPTSTPTPTPTSTPPPAQTAPSSGSSGEPSYMTGTQTGQGTFYDTGLGACGVTNNDGDPIVAVSQSLFDSYPGYNGVNSNHNPVCGRKINVQYVDSTGHSNSATVTVQDRCTGCATTDLDMSPSVFQALAPLSLGRISIKWEWAS